MDIDDVLSSDPDVVSGAVVFKGTRVPVETLFGYLAAGDTLATYLSDFPTVQRSQVEAVLRIASDDLQTLVGKKAA